MENGNGGQVHKGDKSWHCGFVRLPLVYLVARMLTRRQVSFYFSKIVLCLATFLDQKFDTREW